MLDAAQTCQRFVEGRKRDNLDSDQMLALAITRLLESIGEAANQITPSFKIANPEIPWGMIVGMRNFVIHAYFAVDMDVVWNTVTSDVRNLIPQLETLLNP